MDGTRDLAKVVFSKWSDLDGEFRGNDRTGGSSDPDVWTKSVRRDLAYLHKVFIHCKEEMDLLLDFIGQPDSSFKFENDENKGFSCLKKPLPFCLNPAKKGFQIDTC